MGYMALSDYQAAFNGFVVGAGQDYIIFSLDGLEDFTSRSGNTVLPSLWGSQVGGTFLNQRTVIIGVQLTDLSAYDGALEAAFTPPNQSDPSALLPFNFKVPGRPELTFECALVKCSRPRSPFTDVTLARWWFELVAPDPRLYVALDQGVALSPYTAETIALDSTTGAASDLAFDSTTGAASELAVDATGVAGGGPQFATNTGSVDTYPTLTFTTDSDLEQWTLINDTTGEQATFIYSMGRASNLIVDMASVATGKVGVPVTTNGSPNYGAWQPPRVPLRLVPGPNTLRFIVDVGTLGSQCVLDWSSAWL